VIGPYSIALDNMASSSRSGNGNDSNVSNKRQRSSMSRTDDKVVEIDTLRAFTIPKMKKTKHGVLRCFSGKLLTWLQLVDPD